MVKDMMKIGLMIGEIPEVDPKNKERATKYWMYGESPEELAKAWNTKVDKEAMEYAKLKKCANCDYFNNGKKVLKALDADATMGACMKFKFVCAAEASCQAWECESEQWDDD